MFLFSFIFLFKNTKKPVYNIKFVKTKKELPKFGQIIQIPGVDENFFVCKESNKTRTPKFSGSPEELLHSYAGKCYKILGNEEMGNLEFCFEGESFYNGRSLGQFMGYSFENHKLKSYNEGGYVCGEKAFSLFTNYECDNTLPLNSPSIPYYWKESECEIGVVVKSRKLCRHSELSNERVIDVKCIEKKKFL